MVGSFAIRRREYLATIPQLNAKLNDQLELNLNDAITQCAATNPDREVLLESKYILVSLSRVSEKRPWFLECCQKLLSSPYVAARQAVFEAANAIGPVFQTIEPDLVRAINLECAEDDCSEALALEIKSLASIGAKRPDSQEQIRKAMSHPRVKARVAACLAAIYLNIPDSNSRELLQRIISVEPAFDDEVILSDIALPLAQIAVVTMPPEEAIQYLHEQSELLLQQDKRERAWEYCDQLDSASDILEDCFRLVGVNGRD